MKKQIIIALTAVLIITAACFAGGSYYFLYPKNENKILSLELPPYSDDITLEAGETAVNKFITVIYENGFSVKDIIFESSDKSVAEVKYTFTDRNRYVCFKITAISAGETDIYFTADGGNVVSDKIKVTVSEKEYYQAETQSEKETAQTENASSYAPAESSETADFQGDTVYVAPTGKRYHYNKECAGKNGSAVSKEDALSSGRTPCKKCAGG